MEKPSSEPANGEVISEATIAGHESIDEILKVMDQNNTSLLDPVELVVFMGHSAYRRCNLWIK